MGIQCEFPIIDGLQQSSCQMTTMTTRTTRCDQHSAWRSIHGRPVLTTELVEIPCYVTEGQSPPLQKLWHQSESLKSTSLTLNIPSLARQRCLSSWGPRRTPWFFCNFSTVWCGRLLKLCFFWGGFWNYNSVIQALLASNILCLFTSTEVSQ